MATRRDVSDAKRFTATSRGRLQHVSRAAHGVDHRLAPGVDLLAQVGDVELDDVGLAAEVVVPDAVEDLRLGQDPLGVAHQEAEQLELRRGQRDLRTVAAYLVAVLVELEVADAQHGRRLRTTRTRRFASGRAAGRRAPRGRTAWSRSRRHPP